MVVIVRTGRGGKREAMVPVRWKAMHTQSVDSDSDRKLVADETAMNRTPAAARRAWYGLWGGRTEPLPSMMDSKPKSRSYLCRSKNFGAASRSNPSPARSSMSPIELLMALSFL